MPLTGVYFLPNPSGDTSSLQPFLSHLTSLYKTHPLPRWTLEHRLFRETPPTTHPDESRSPTPAATRYLQILTLSHHPARSYIAITTLPTATPTRISTPAAISTSTSHPPPSSPPPIIVSSLPPGPPTDEFLQLLLSKFGPLWTQRHALSVSTGLGFETGEYRIRVGEARQGFGAAQTVVGVVVEVEWRGMEEGEEGAGEEAERMIRVFWEGMAVPRARECLAVAGGGSGDGTVRQWCEVLRLRT